MCFDIDVPPNIKAATRFLFGEKKKDIYFNRWIASCKLKIRDILFSLFIYENPMFLHKNVGNT